MKLWEKSIIEWINCLKVLEEPVTSTIELQNGMFYIKFLNLIKWKKHKEEEDGNRENVIIKFLEDQYPSFKVNRNDGTEHIYIASVLLVHLCQKQSAIHHSLQYNMCDKLVDETQFRVKVFLENILPLGKDVTKETIKDVIMEVENLSLSVHKKSPQKFSISARSTEQSKRLLTVKLRELKDVKCNLALERFTNAELQSDIAKQQDKIKSLQKKLEERTEQLKTLREEWMRPNTPQSSHRKKESLEEELQYYSKYIKDLESQLSKQQDEIDKLETEKDTLVKQLSCAQKSSIHYKESFVSCEKFLESLSDKIEMKDRELVALRMHNEELRAHIKGLTKNPAEQSFEGDDPSFSTTMNTSEALSTVIEIQLQEAREESAVLHAQVDSLKEKLDLLTKDYKTALESNRDLQNNLKTFAQTQTELDAARRELKTSNKNIAKLQTEKESLVAETENLTSLLLRKEKELSDTEQSSIALNAELDALKVDIKNLSELLENEKTNSENLSTALTQARSEVTEHLAHIHKLGADRDFYRSFIENCSSNLRDILRCGIHFTQCETDNNNLDNLTLNDLTLYVEKTLRTYDTVCTSYKSDVEKLRLTLDETNANLSEQELTITRLEERNRQNLIKLAALEENKKQTDLLLNEREEIIHKYSEEIETFEQIRDEKYVLEQSVRELKKGLICKEESLKSFKTLVKDLKEDFKSMKEETHRSVTNYRNASKLTFEKLQQSYQTLLHNFDEVQREKEELECNFNCNKEELLSAQAVIVTSRQTLLENKEMINIFEEKERTLYNELNETKQIVENLKKTNQALAIMKTEANGNLENLKSENHNLSLELRVARDKIDSLQQEISDVTTQVESKKEEITELLMNVSSLNGEKQHLMRLHEEIVDAKNKEMKIMEDTLLMLRSKMEKLTNEANVRESKMKEVIVNLQEVRASQDAVLVTQEATLKEKCLYIKELQERFDNSKLLNDELENTKLLVNEYQIKLSHLENQINNQNKALTEAREMLRDLGAELEASKERCELLDASQAEIVKLCVELEYSMRNLNSTILRACSDFDFLQQDLHDDASQHERTHNDNKIANILSVIEMTLDEVHKSEKVILGLSRVNTELNKALTEQSLLVKDSVKDKEEVYNLKSKIQELEIIAQKRNDYLKSLIKDKESLRDFLQRLFVSQHDADVFLTSLSQKWAEILTRFQSVLCAESSVCDEVKQLHAKKTSLENTLFKHQTDHLENIKALSQILWEKFLWTEQTLLDTYLCSAHERECLDILNMGEKNEFSQEKTAIDAKLEECKRLQTDAMKSEREIESFSALATVCENSVKSGEIKSYAEIEKKLQSQISQLTKERKDLKDKMDTMRARNIKLEKSIDDLRTEIRKLKATEVAPTETNSTEIKFLKDEIERLREQTQQLHEEKEESTRISKQDFEKQLKDVHATYEQKLDDMKQKVKAVYNEQVMKLNKEQEKIIQERLQSQMEIMCQKHKEELYKYKVHISELSSQLWSVGEKLLIEQQQKDDALKRLKERSQFTEIETDQPITISRKTCKVEKQETLSENAQQTEKKVTTVTTTEETLERRHSIRSIQAMGNAFKTEDEEEVFDNNYLADMKKGDSSPNPAPDNKRLSTLQERNSNCKPHLKSSYPMEMQYLSLPLSEEYIKGQEQKPVFLYQGQGSVEENFNDSLSQSLLPEQKAKKKDRTQTSYKRPGPPTPSKNGGRLSLQGNELRSPSSRILKERNVDRRTTTTPYSLKNFFSLKRQDENVSVTPKGRRLSNLFRKPKGAIKSTNECGDSSIQKETGKPT